MQITRNSTVADVATSLPATIKVFQQHEIDFCCGGKRPLAEACAERGLEVEALLGELRAATAPAARGQNWEQAPMTDLVAHIQARFHGPLRQELPRLGQMLVKVVSRHGDRHPETRPLQETFNALHAELLHHMQKEDAILFPAVVALESGRPDGFGGFAWIDQPIEVMEAEHEEAGRALATMRELTGRYTPPDDACPTFRGLYHGLAELERDLHEHIHLENNVLFPRAARLAQAR
jgi:regulator of cell morphogenesis and NO signaling